MKCCQRQATYSNVLTLGNTTIFYVAVTRLLDAWMSSENRRFSASWGPLTALPESLHTFHDCLHVSSENLGLGIRGTTWRSPEPRSRLSCKRWGFVVPRMVPLMPITEDFWNFSVMMNYRVNSSLIWSRCDQISHRVDAPLQHHTLNDHNALRARRLTRSNFLSS